MHDPNATHDEADHLYDGIREYDNPMPRWWVLCFWGTFFFSLGYVFHYFIGNGISVSDAYAAEVQEHEAARAREALAAGSVDEASLTQLMRDPALLADGQSKFVTVCGACHAASGGGLIGPNLTDAYWIHGKGSLTDIFAVVSHGVPEKGMPAWEKSLRPDELRKVVAYVGSLRNTNVPNGKAPEGTLATAEQPMP